jgi:hypothetical protein
VESHEIGHFSECVPVPRNEADAAYINIKFDKAAYKAKTKAAYNAMFKGYI